MSTAAPLRISRPRHAHSLNKETLKQLEKDKKKRQHRRQHHEVTAKRRSTAALRISKKLEETRRRFNSTMPSPVPQASDVEMLDMLLAKRARAAFGPPIVLNAR